MTNKIDKIDKRIPGGLAIITVLYLLVLLPVLPQVSTYHSDEHFYTDAGVYMLENHDILNPHYADGSLRTKKPIVAYWAIIVSYAVFGVNFFGARLLFLVAGGLTLWLTYHLALRLFADRWVATLASVILASNLQFISLSVRATPDIVQCLFLNLSLYGFIAIILHNDLRLRNYLFAYYGAAIAIQTKGALGVVLIAFVLIFFYFSKNKKDSFKDILHWPIMISALAIALSWYLYIIHQYGAGALWSFFSDQVAEKVGGSKYYILVNVKDYLWGVVRSFLPWALVLVLGIKYRTLLAAEFKQSRKEYLFATAWFLILLLIFIGSNDCRTRYLIPAFPLLSVMLSSILVTLYRQKSVQRFWRWGHAFIIVSFVLLAAVLCVLGAILDGQLVAAGAMIILGILLARFLVSKFETHMFPFAMGLMLLVTIASLQALVLPVFEFAPSRQIANCIQSYDDSTTPVTVWSRHRANYLRQLHTVTNGRILVKTFSHGTLPENFDNRPIVVLSENDRERVSPSDYDIQPCGYIFKTPRFRVLSQALMTGNKDVAFQEMQEPIYLARRLR